MAEAKIVFKIEGMDCAEEVSLLKREILPFAGYASLWAAIAADMGASLLVIGNGLRLLAGRTSPLITRELSA